jgi:predicted RNA-binding protein YlxR (DUF448 family)
MILDQTGRAAGRGAYLCADGACWQTAIDRNVLQRALEAQLPSELRQALETRIRTHAAGAGIEVQTEGDMIGQK